MSRAWQSSLGRIYLAVLAAAAISPMLLVVSWFAVAVPFHWGLNYNEGIVWKQMLEIVAGRGYAPIDRFPAIVFHYPPVYHLAMAGLWKLGLDPLVAGRVVSLAATAGATVCVGLLATRLLAPHERPFARFAALAAAFLYLQFEAVHFWAPQVRVDALAGFFALAGTCCALAALTRPRLIHMAAVAFVLSLYTKQISLIAPAACFGVLLVARPALALRGIATAVLLGSVVLVWLALATDGGALRHMFLYNINRFELARLVPNLLQGVRWLDRPIVAVGCIGVAVAARRWWRARDRWRDPAQLSMLILLALFALNSASLIAVAKSGSSSSYFMPWEGSLAMFAGFATTLVLRAAARKLADDRWVPALLLALLPLALVIWPAQHDGRHIAALRAMDRNARAVAALLSGTRGPVISDDMVLLLRTGRDVVWEPAIFAELAHTGMWDERQAVVAIRGGQVGAVVSELPWYKDRYNPAVQAAIADALPRTDQVGITVVHRPADPSTGAKIAAR
jgi:hypothetical protein